MQGDGLSGSVRRLLLRRLDEQDHVADIGATSGHDIQRVGATLDRDPNRPD